MLPRVPKKSSNLGFERGEILLNDGPDDVKILERTFAGIGADVPPIDVPMLELVPLIHKSLID
jgi:hypothetical protein